MQVYLESANGLLEDASLANAEALYATSVRQALHAEKALRREEQTAEEVDFLMSGLRRAIFGFRKRT